MQWFMHPYKIVGMNMGYVNMHAYMNLGLRSNRKCQEVEFEGMFHLPATPVFINSFVVITLIGQ